MPKDLLPRSRTFVVFGGDCLCEHYKEGYHRYTICDNFKTVIQLYTPKTVVMMQRRYRCERVAILQSIDAGLNLIHPGYGAHEIGVPMRKGERPLMRIAPLPTPPSPVDVDVWYDCE